MAETATYRVPTWLIQVVIVATCSGLFGWLIWETKTMNAHAEKIAVVEIQQKNTGDDIAEIKGSVSRVEELLRQDLNKRNK